MRIEKIEYIETIRPNMSCGTGYSEPDKFLITTSDSMNKKIYIDIWYRRSEDFREIFEKSINKNYKDIENMDDAYIMWLNELGINKLCPDDVSKLIGCSKRDFDLYSNVYVESKPLF